MSTKISMRRTCVCVCGLKTLFPVRIEFLTPKSTHANHRKYTSCKIA